VGQVKKKKIHNTSSAVIDQNFFQFLLPTPAIETRTGVGGTPLFVTKSGSASVTVVLPGHGLSVGATFPVQVATAVGGLVLSGELHGPEFAEPGL